MNEPYSKRRTHARAHIQTLCVAGIHHTYLYARVRARAAMARADHVAKQ